MSWKAERVVAPSEARAMIEARFPELAPVRLQPFGEGFDNTAYLVDEAFVFRFPRRQLGADLMATELAVLPHLAGRLPLSVPDPSYVGEPSRDYPWPFAGYRLLDGHTACRALPDDAARAALAAPLASFLATLHALPADEAREWGAPPDLLGRMDLAKRIPMARDYLGRLRVLGLIEDVAPLLDLVDDVENRYGIEAPPAPAVLLHGDLYARHLLIDEVGALSGVIDWGDVHVGHPATDLAVAHMVLPPRAHGAFRAAYGPIPDDVWRLARFRAVYHAAVVVAYGHDVGDDPLLAAGLQALGYVARP